MTRIYFDVTNIIQYAARNNTVIGIPRVQLNIISFLAGKYSGDIVRCTFFDASKKAMFEFDPAERRAIIEFDGEQLLLDLGLIKDSRLFPSKVQVKSYLRRYRSNKVLRTLKKIDVYLSALLMPTRLHRMGFKKKTHGSGNTAIAVTELSKLSPDSSFVCLGAIWFLPEIWKFAKAHKDRGGKVVQMVYDLLPYSHPQYYSAKEPPAFIAWLDSALEYANRFICISRWTASDLQQYSSKLNHHPRIEVVPLAHEFIGFDRFSKIESSPQLTPLINCKYILCVGTIEYRKNGVALLQVWKQLIREVSANLLPLLVFAGKYGNGSTDFQAVLEKDEALAQYVRIIHAPSDQELAWLYQNCLFTTFPSENEGWGLPVGEAAWFGKFCVASNATSIPEVCGGLADYIDPTDEQSIKAGILKPILNNEYLSTREENIRKNFLRKWNNVAEDIYQSVTAP